MPEDKRLKIFAKTRNLVVDTGNKSLSLLKQTSKEADGPPNGPAGDVKFSKLAD